MNWKLHDLLSCAGAIAMLTAATLAQSPPAGTAKPKDPPQQPAPSPVVPPASPDAAKPEPPTDDPIDSDLDLDSLLGTKPKSPGTGAGSAAAADLNRKLSAKELGDAFHEAVVLMGDAAGRINKSKDTGVTTQRVQEDIVRKLDLLIEQLEQQSQSSSSRQQQSQSQDQQQQSQRRQQQRQQSETRNGENNSEMDPPSRRDGALGPDIDAARAAWGSLPERVRQMLLQGSSDKFSEAYKKLTQEYYRKLAEEGKK